MALQPPEDQIEIVVALHGVEHLGVDDEQRCRVVGVEEARIAFRHAREIALGDLLFGIQTTPAHAFHQGIGFSLQVDYQIGRRRLRLQVLVNLLVQRVFVVRQVHRGEQRILVEQEIRHHAAGEQVVLRQVAQLVHALEQKRQLGRQRVALHVLIEARQERIVLRLLQQGGGTEALRQSFWRDWSCRRRSVRRRRCIWPCRASCRS